MTKLYELFVSVSPVLVIKRYVLGHGKRCLGEPCRPRVVMLSQYDFSSIHDVGFSSRPMRLWMGHNFRLGWGLLCLLQVLILGFLRVLWILLQICYGNYTPLLVAVFVLAFHGYKLTFTIKKEEEKMYTEHNLAFFSQHGHGRSGRAGVNVIIMCGMMNYQREYDEYHEGYDHGADTHEGYHFVAYGRNAGDGRWKCLRSINAFYGNRSYGDETMVERKLIDSGDIIELRDHVTFLNSLATYLERRYFIEFNFISCAIPRVDEYHFSIANYVSCMLRVEDRRNMEKDLGPILEYLSISLSLNPSSLYYEVSLEELKSLLDSYTFQVSLIGDMYIIAFKENLFLLVPSMKNCLSSHFSLEDPLMSSNIVFDPSCYGFGSLDDNSLVELNVVSFMLEFDRNSLQHVCTITSTRGRRHTMEFEG
ncbi:hypothetical protein M9H77_30679 [Catharanthus roseus]|uniref:Uncharacterized protein n=1 Tax=Catharanthus roseus TaxID=4058 RepID=A0ACC0A0K0_CATRO|nr:hypothetical protein M9H77_30679 [Catharanthus roseus]